MKKLEGLTETDKEALKTPLEQVAPNAVINIHDLRLIDKLCLLLEQKTDTIEFEDTDYNYLKSKFEAFTGWNPAQETRRVVMTIGDKLK